MKYKITLNNRTYEVEVEAGKAMLLAEYETVAPAAPTAPVATPAAVAAAPAAPAAAPVETAPVVVEEVPADLAPGSAGQLKLYDTPPKTAAMLMAIVADTMGKPLNELRFISIKEVKEK